jgi:UDP-3-O-[3-hydroxymyristoyl] glucosamine N-acyltransferase
MYSLRQLAGMIKADLVGDPDATVRRARPFEVAEEGDVTLALDPRYREQLGLCRATAVIVESAIDVAGANLLVCRNPKLAFARAIHALHSKPQDSSGVSADLAAGEGTRLGTGLSIHPRVTIGREVLVGDRVRLHSGVVIGDRCRIGDDTIIHANVSIYSDCEIGNRCIIHSGTVIGADGFGFVPDEEGHQVKLLQLGRVVIEDDCEIGANCAIDRGGFGDTVLRRGVKLDNLVQVGHGCELGEDTVVAAFTGFSGGTVVGKRCVIAGQVGTNAHIKIGDGSVIFARTGVTKSVQPGSRMAGMTPAQEYNAWRRSQVLYSKLPEIAQRLKGLENKVKELINGKQNGDE